VFGDPATGAYLIKFSWTRIVRHVAVRGGASPDDPSLAGYWAERRRKRTPPPLDAHTLNLLKAQDDRCPACGALLIDAEQEPQPPQEWEQWFIDVRRTLRKQRVVQRVDDPADERTWYRLVHARCLRPQAGRAATSDQPQQHRQRRP
jgi:RNA-directed DNA polymerase